jgi:uncharacterized protein DUF3810
MSRRHVAWTAVILAAVGAVLAPLPQPLVERLYSRGVYPRLQRLVTPVSNLLPFALFDLLCVIAIVTVALHLRRSVRALGGRGGLARTIVIVLRGAAVTYLIFLATWGMNYRRVPLVDKVAFDPSRVTRQSAGELGARAVEGLNHLYAEAHSHPTSLEDLSRAFHDAQTALHSPVPIVPGRPKMTLLGGYFHEAAIAGMTDPFLLETLIAPDLLDVERPFVIAHEWAHLAGYADESEANYVAWLTCMRGDAGAQYSAWLMLIGYVRPAGFRANTSLDAGPRIDVFAIGYRYGHTLRPVRFAARQSYDMFLKANRVRAGIDSYDLIVQLILGTPVDARGNPAFR